MTSSIHNLRVRVCCWHFPSVIPLDIGFVKLKINNLKLLVVRKKEKTPSKTCDARTNTAYAWINFALQTNGREREQLFLHHTFPYRKYDYLIKNHSLRLKLWVVHNYFTFTQKPRAAQFHCFRKQASFLEYQTRSQQVLPEKWVTERVSFWIANRRGC